MSKLAVSIPNRVLGALRLTLAIVSRTISYVSIPNRVLGALRRKEFMSRRYSFCFNP